MFKDSAGSALSSHSSVNCFITVVQQKFRSLARLKTFLIDNHYKTIYGKVGTERSSCRVLERRFVMCVACSLYDATKEHALLNVTDILY